MLQYFNQYFNPSSGKVSKEKLIPAGQNIALEEMAKGLNPWDIPVLLISKNLYTYICISALLNTYFCSKDTEKITTLITPN